MNLDEMLGELKTSKFKKDYGPSWEEYEEIIASCKEMYNHVQESEAKRLSAEKSLLEGNTLLNRATVQLKKSAAFINLLNVEITKLKEDNRLLRIDSSKKK